MSRVVIGYRLPSPGYVMRKGQPSDGKLIGRFWCTYAGPGVLGDGETLDVDGWDTARDAQLDAWQHHAVELRAALQRIADIRTPGDYPRNIARAALGLS